MLEKAYENTCIRTGAQYGEYVRTPPPPPMNGDGELHTQTELLERLLQCKWNGNVRS